MVAPPADSKPYQLGYLVSKLSAKHVLRAWFQHLSWQAAGANAKTIWLFLDEPWVFAPLPKLQAEHFLQAWLENYYTGLQQPLLLAVDSALEYAKVFHNPKKTEDDAAFEALFDEPPPQALRVSAAHRVKICRAWCFWSCIMVRSGFI